MDSHPLFTLDKLYHAYRQCRRRKRNTYNALIFEQNMEAELLNLHEELNSGRYTPQPALAFLVQQPKRREIFAADFRDRVVHHLLVSHLEPAWERRFIYDSYACRRGKGTHLAVDRLRTFTRQVTKNETRRAGYLQLDVRGFFITLNRHILFQRLEAKESDSVVLWLIKVILFNEPTQNYRLRPPTHGSDFDSLPPHKTLFKAAPGCGLPIGNLTSQFFANVYLDALDQFVKHHLKAHYYVRYCDDLVLLSTDFNQLQNWEVQIAKFLRDHLQLDLNDRRKLRPLSDGIDFLGYIVRPAYLLVRRRVIGNLYDRLHQAEQRLQGQGMNNQVYPYPWEDLQKIRQWLNAYLSHCRHANTYRLMASCRRRFHWLEEYFYWLAGKVVYRCPTPSRAVRWSQQLVWFRGHLPGHVLMIQIGRSWEMNLSPSQHYRIISRHLTSMKQLLWESEWPVAWIEETDRRITGITERQLSCRWHPARYAIAKATPNLNSKEINYETYTTYPHFTLNPSHLGKCGQQY
jgi:hypothetical protein